MSPAMFILYYAFGLHISRKAKNCKDFIDKYKQIIEKKNGSEYKTFSGTSLNYEGDELKISKKTTNYIHEYRDFIQKIKASSKPTAGKKTVIKLDVEKYFENFDITTLLAYLNIFSLSETGEELFSNAFIENSVDFFKILGDDGLPQEQSFLISQYLSDLYLTKFDLKFLDFLRTEEIKFSYFRYIDDIYLILEADHESKISIQQIIQTAEQMMKQELDLYLSTKKQEVHVIDSQDSWKELIKTVSFVSLVDENTRIDDLDLTTEDAQRLVMKVLTRLSKINPYELFSEDFSNVKKNLNVVFASKHKILTLLKKNFSEELKKIKELMCIDVFNIPPKPLCAIFDDEKEFYPWLLNRIFSERVTNHRFSLVFHYLINQPELTKKNQRQDTKTLPRNTKFVPHKH